MGKKLLVVEKDPYDGKILEKVYSDQYQIKIITKEKEVPKALRQFQPEVLVLDMRIPEVECIRRISEIKTIYNPDLPVIVIVSENSLEVERFAREQGIFYYLIKPFDFKEFEQVLQAAFENIKKKCSAK